MVVKQGNLISLSILLTLGLPWITTAAECTQSDISNLAVSGCTCPSSFHACSNTCPLGNGCGQNSNLVDKCDVGCTDDNKGCETCNLYFGGLCRCLRDGDCFHDSSTGSWTLLHSKTLITTPHLLPGILDLGPDNNGWRLGQITLLTGQFSSWDDGTLAMNSVTSRTEEQIHIHVCDRPTSVLRKYLEQKDAVHYSSLTPMDFDQLGFQKDSVHCQAAKTKDFDMAKLVSDYLNTLGAGCAKYHAGAGLITDKYGNTWGCVTTQGSAEFLFCMN
ncbi:hypothetical protein BDV34DRAFT_204071 [Aspergillus parasiticus]|uniref:Uncharacterized protein n=1 Tax=Aspergillus parasiticus TaxID=5067 RepID=A0A5N6D677_ASPPA|nr:hypothetical protein BDV34DRAFT_204071 [Aspergillus parasiticus]